MTVGVLTATLIAGCSTSESGPAWHPAAAAPPSVSVPEPSDEPVAGVSPSEEPTRETLAEDVLQLKGRTPTTGSGKFTFSGERGPVAGRKGKLHRFKVAVEKGSGEDVDDFTAQVRATLEDDRSWSGSGKLRLQMVAGTDKADFTVYLATRDTAGRMCEQGGTNIRIGGVPFTSCRTTGKAILNLDRWRKSSTPYLEAKVGLAEYRRYVINHEVGHELGHRHEGCPKAGGPAPVMVQQTLILRGCKPYSWPRRNDKDLSGPLL